MLGAAYQAIAQDAPTPYANRAPIEQYLMDRTAEIALARSAAPDAISRDATVLVLGRHGYKTAVEGKNGWVCMVGRGWGALFDWPEFWNPKVRAAECLNPPAARSMLPFAYKRTELLLAVIPRSRSSPQSRRRSRKNNCRLEPGAVSYMMSKSSYLTDNGNHNVPHLMFYAPIKDVAAWGANVPNSPVMAVDYWYLSEQSYPQLQSFPPIAVFLVAVGKWSDGTLAPSMSGRSN